MRTEQEMMELILQVAEQDERIRAVYMNGSRANPGALRDEFQDFDIVYVVTGTEDYVNDRNWINVFGEPAMVQEPDANDFGWGQQADYTSSYCWLMLFQDGWRIDLHVQTVAAMEKEYGTDSLTVPLLDKDNILPRILPSNDSGYWIQCPGPFKYAGCCNEFWWCLNNVAKGIVREQLSYVMRMYYETVHKELEQMLEWYIGSRMGFKVTSGMWGKYFQKYLPEELYEMYVHTYPDGEYDNIWKAVFQACELFSISAKDVAERLGYEYREADERNMMRYLEKMR